MLDFGKDKCCGCNACEFVCPKDAISMVRDEYGFRYPKIDEDKCISCGLCEKICAFQDKQTKVTKQTYASINLNSEQKGKSSSGGIFAALAEQFIRNGGYVCGSEFKVSNKNANISHCVINSVEDICRLQGSKYVQSNLDCLSEINELLKKNKKILFSGTPCQVAQIQKLFKKYSDQLYTIDIICHGVPNQKWFNEYLKIILHKNELVDFNFRNKDNGWGHEPALFKYKQNNEIRNEYIDVKKSSYYNYFLACETFRDSCYNCPFATMDRTGDLTLGDCWGIENFAPELLSENGGKFVKNEGISCVLVNSDRGEYLLEICKEVILSKKVDINDVSVINKQLKEPAKHTKIRNHIMKIYPVLGYRGVDTYFKITNYLKTVKHNIWQWRNK